MVQDLSDKPDWLSVAESSWCVCVAMCRFMHAEQVESIETVQGFQEHNVGSTV